MASYLAQFTQPDMAEMLENSAKQANCRQSGRADINFNEELAELGFPSYTTP